MLHHEIILSAMATKDGKCGNYQPGDRGLATASDISRHDWSPCLSYDVELRLINSETGEVQVILDNTFHEYEDAFRAADQLREEYPEADYEEVAYT